ncbi:MAG TPA: hypothetical protein VN554_02955, partial [Verrucomicrobiae bacterium]|nr:hypothetical protein [Verrucomicrobiae bacterium]
PDQAYNFITEPARAPRTPLLSQIPGGNSLIGRISLAGGGLLLLVILFSVINGFINRGPDLTSAFTVVQEQQAVLHLANEVRGSLLSPATANANTNVQLSVGTSQSELISYMTKNHFKIKPKLMNAKISHSTDAQLDVAYADKTYEPTYRSLLQQKLTAYMKALQASYQQIKGPKGQALLKDSYHQAQLLQLQLNTPGS